MKNKHKTSACSFGGSLRVQSNVLILVSSLAIVLARLRGALRRGGVWRLLRELGISISQLPVGSSLGYDVYYAVASADYFGLAHEGTYVRLGLNDHMCKTFIRYCNGCKLWYSVQIMCNDRLIMGSLC